MCDEVTKSENVSASRKRGDAITASPRPWRIPEVGLVPTEIWSADGTLVARGVSGLNASLICDAVNGRDRLAADEARYRTDNVVLRDMVRRLADNLANYHIVGERERALLREAREAIGEVKP